MTALRRCLTSATIALAAGALPAIAAAQESGWPSPIHDDQLFWKVFAEQAELAVVDGAVEAAWDAHGWIGDDFDRFWVKSEGSAAAGGETRFDVQALYGRLVHPFWDLQAGIRYEQRFAAGVDRARVHAAFGLQGLAPYWFELEPTLFVSDDGDFSARVEASYDLLITQRLVVQPDLEINVAAQAVEEWGVGSGLNDVSLALRLRYEVRREVAPYVGVEWGQQFGGTADLARAQGKDIRRFEFLAGVRIWF